MRRTELLATHMADGRTAANLVLSQWSNTTNLWASQPVTLTLSSGIATYACSLPVTNVRVMYLNYGGTDRILTGISNTDYASIPVKNTYGVPTMFWFDKQINPSISFWPNPDISTYVVTYYCLKQFDDADLASGLTVDIPYRFYDAFVACMAARLARTYRPELSQQMEADADKAWMIAAAGDVEDVALYVTPDLSGYWRP